MNAEVGLISPVKFSKTIFMMLGLYILINHYNTVAFKIENNKPKTVKEFFKDQLITTRDEYDDFYKLNTNGVKASIEKKATTNRKKKPGA